VTVYIPTAVLQAVKTLMS